MGKRDGDGGQQEFAAFRATPEPLPPFMERIAHGLEGEREFEKLMHQLLLVHAERNCFGYTAAAGDGGMDGIAHNGIPGLDGMVAFQFKVFWDDIDEAGNAVQIIDLLERASKTSKDLKHWILVTPRELKPSESKWLQTVKRRRGIRVDSWGQAKIEELLRQCPALLARYYPQIARLLLDGYDCTDFREFARNYRAEVTAVHGRIKMIGLPPETVSEPGSRPELLLSKLFIPLRLIPDKDGASPRDLARVLTERRSAVVLGDPGMGKSTLLAYLALLFSGEASLDGFSPPLEAIPLFVSLRDFVRAQKAQPNLSFPSYLATRARERLRLPQAHWTFFEAVLRMGEAVILFDGLDEVGDDHARRTIADAIGEFRTRFPACPAWVTSRRYGYNSHVRLSGDGFNHYLIDRFDDTQINGFIERWYTIQIQDDPADCHARAASLRDAVHRTPSVRRLASNPLLLTLMAFIHHGLRKLPQDRAELYERCVEMLLKTWQEARHDDDATASPAAPQIHVQTQKDYLAHLAFVVQEKNQHGKGDGARGEFSRSNALDCLGNRHWQWTVRDRPSLTRREAREEMRRFLEYIGDQTGLVIALGLDQLSFIHLSFQEYLAAWVFTCNPDMPSGPEFFEEHLGDPAWEEVLLLRLYLVLRAPGGGGTDEFDRIITRLLRRMEKKSSPQEWFTLVRALRDNLAFRPQHQKTILQHAVGFWLDAPAFEGTWFTALEEVCLFAERARSALHEIVAEGRTREPAARALACLHLEARLFGFPEDAAEVLRTRTDLTTMLPDLVAFLGEPGIDTLLAEQATVADWSAALSAFDGPTLYRRTLAWTLTPPSKAAVEAALGLLWRKILEDHRSRRKFGATRWGGDGAMLLQQPGSVIATTPFSSAVLPLSGIRILPCDLPSGKAGPTARVLYERFAWERLDAVGKQDSRAELTAWTSAFINTQLARFQPVEALDPEAIHRLASTFVRNFDRDSVRDFSRNLVRSLGRNFGRDHSHDFVLNFIVRDLPRDLDRDLGRDIVRVFAHDFGRAFVRDSGRAFIRGFPVDPSTSGLDVNSGHSMDDEAGEFRLLQRDDFWSWAYRRIQERLEPSQQTTELNAQLIDPLALPFLLLNVWNGVAHHHMFMMFRHVRAFDAYGDLSDEALELWLRRNPVDVYGVAFAWEEHAKTFADGHQSLTGTQGALFLAHAAYASLMTGLECKAPLWRDLLIKRDLNDPRVHISSVLYDLCHFLDAWPKKRELDDILASPYREIVPIVEAAGFIVVSPELPSPRTQPVQAPSPPTKPQVDKPPLFGWLHLSDLYLGHKDISRHWDQALVLDVLQKDIAEMINQGIPAPNALLVTGDIAYSGTADEFETARTWLLDLAGQLKLEKTYIFVVPGNHDVDRSEDKTNSSLRRLLRSLHDGSDPLDEALANANDRDLLIRRMTAYLTFAADFQSLQTPNPLFWSHPFIAPSGLRLRLIGLNTALLAADDLDKGKLRLGKAALAATLTNLPENELLLVLTHHPFRDGWLADQREADAWIKGRAHIHLFGHVHEADSEEARSGMGTSLIRIAAGAAYDAKLPPGVPASHGYSFAAVIPADDGTLRLRVWPRRWSDKNKTFTVDADNTSPDRPYAEHILPGLKLSLVMAPPPGLRGSSG